MFIETLKISSKYKTIREMKFRKGMNVIIDNTPTTNDLTLTGNNVGKTTVLKLIYFCLGGEGKDIYTDEENKNKVYDEVKKFLIDNEVLITLTLRKEFDSLPNDKIIIERNFLKGKHAIRKINGEDILKKDFEKVLSAKCFPDNKNEKPSFKQIISHNIRYKENSVNRTLRTLDAYTSDVEYESLYLYLLGCRFDRGDQKQLLSNKIKQEYMYKERLEKKEKKNSYEVALALLETEIEELNLKKSKFNINKNFEKDLDSLNEIKYKINKLSSCMTKLELRRDLISESKIEMEGEISTIDLVQLKSIYNEARKYIPNLHKTFEQLIKYHNKMILEKVLFITKELPELNDRISEYKDNIKQLLIEEERLMVKVSKSHSFVDLESIISELNERYRLKGEYENTISQINDVETNIETLENELENIDQFLYSKEFQAKLKERINRFNKYFSSVSYNLYGEKYALTYEIVNNKKTKKPVYKFSTFNYNMSSGKKQGEILCFDLAYILFANESDIPCLHFLLNDKKELMHDNQLMNIADFVMGKKLQLVVSILRDKLPEGLVNKVNIVVELSQEDKLFRVE